MSVAPPLPPKKRHIKAYMEMVGPYSQPSEVELFRQSMEAYHLKAAQWHENSEDLFLARASSFLTAPPPLLPPKKKQLSCPAISSVPVLALEASKNPSAERSLTEESETTPPLLPVQRNEGPGPSPLPGNGASSNDSYDVDDGVEELDLSSDLILKQPEDEGPEVRGGGVDALIIHAAKLNKDDYLYQAAFLATYRTFISPLELTRKLIHRYDDFRCCQEVHRIRLVLLLHPGDALSPPFIVMRHQVVSVDVIIIFIFFVSDVGSTISCENRILRFSVLLAMPFRCWWALSTI